MKLFTDYFSAQQIIKLLCKFRIKYAKQRHKVHLLRDISLHDSTLENFKKKYHCPVELASMLPSRRTWRRLNAKDRKKYNTSADVAIESLRRTILTIHIRVKNGSIPAPAWYQRLLLFIQSIQERVSSENSIPIQKPTIIAIKKENKKNCRKFRPISQYSLADRIVIGQTARYLTSIFDDQLLDCAYAFRAKKKGAVIKTHHDTIAHILNYKKLHMGKDIYVAECDIKKFFDCVNHEQIKKIFNTFVEARKLYHPSYDDRATTLFYQYLDSYAFNLDVYPLKDSNYFTMLGFDKGEFEWPEEVLKREFYGNNINNIRIGVPQGGALSCLVANLLLHNVDEAVLENRNDKSIAYFRFCDDMILLDTNKHSCDEALNRYISAIKKNFLLIHEPKELVRYDSKFFNSDISKSKKPYRWSDQVSTNTAPWISFVGYQIRHDGSIRVRKKSIQKEVKKQEIESTEVLKAICHSDFENINSNSRKSLKQQVIALESRFIAMSVGRFKIFNYKNATPSLCWTNGFKRLSTHSVSKSQLRFLDSKRNRHLFILKKKLALLNKKSNNPDLIELPTKYLGYPFSYFGFLRKKNRHPKL